MNFNFNFKDMPRVAEASIQPAANVRDPQRTAHSGIKLLDPRREVQADRESDSLQKSIRPLQLRKQLFLGMKLGRMHAPPAPAQLHRMFQVQHLVVDDVLHGVTWDQELIEDAADHNRIMCRIVVPQNAARLGWTPTHARTAEQSVKKAAVQILEYYIKIVDPPLRRMKLFASAHLPHQMRLANDVAAANIFSVASGVASIDGLAIHLRQQNMGDSSNHRIRSAFQQIREPDQKPAFT